MGCRDAEWHQSGVLKRTGSGPLLVAIHQTTELAERQWSSSCSAAFSGRWPWALWPGPVRPSLPTGGTSRSINSSDVLVNIPVPGTSVIAKVSAVPGVRSGAAWLGLNANPVVHGRVDDAFLTDALDGTYHGAFFTQDAMTVLHGRLPRLGATGEIALTPGVARLFGVGLGGRVTYQFLNGADQLPVSTGYSSYRVVGIVEIPPALVDQFDQTQGAVLPPAATAAAVAQHRNAVEFSWVGLRLAKGSAGIPALQATLAGLAERLGGPGASFDIRRLDTVHQQVQDAIRPQAVALGVFGALVALAMLILVGQSLNQLLDRSVTQLELLGALGMTRAEVALAGGFEGAVAVIAGVALAIAGAVAISPLAPVGPVRQFDPAKGVQFDVIVLLGGGLLLLLLLLALLALLAWRSVRVTVAGRPRPAFERRPSGGLLGDAAGGCSWSPLCPRTAARPSSGNRARQPGGVGRRCNRGDRGGGVRCQSERPGLSPGSLRLELERAHAGPRRVWELLGLRPRPAHGGSARSAGMVDLRLHPTTHRRPVGPGPRAGQSQGCGGTTDRQWEPVAWDRPDRARREQSPSARQTHRRHRRGGNGFHEAANDHRGHRHPAHPSDCS